MPAEFDDWVVRTILNPAVPLFREACYLLAEETDIRDPALYNSVLRAIAMGNSTRGGIANHVGRKSFELLHPLNVLEDCGLVTREADPFHSRRSVADPVNRCQIGSDVAVLAAAQNGESRRILLSARSNGAR